MNEDERTLSDILTKLHGLGIRKDQAAWGWEVEQALRALAREQTSAARLLGYIEDAKQTAETWKARAVRAEDLAREKADAAPSPAQAAERLDAARDFFRAQVGRLEAKLDATQDERDAALRRAEAVSEKHLESLRALEAMTARAEDAEKELEHKRNGMTDLSNRLEMTGEALRTAETNRNIFRARVGELESKLDAAVTAQCWRCEATVTVSVPTSKRQQTELNLAHQDVAALRADFEGLSKLHEQDKAELVRWRNAAKELRTSWVRGHDEHTRTEHVDGCCCLHCLIARDVTRILDAAEKP